MSSLLADSTPFMAYVDRRELLKSLLSEDAFRARRQVYLNHTTTVYVGNLSFYTTEQQLLEHFRPCGAIRDIFMGLSETRRTPCGFCFIVYEAQAGAAAAVAGLHGTLLDDRVLHVGWDVGCDETRRWGRGAHGGQVVDAVRQNLDEGRGGLGALRCGALGVEASLAEEEMVAYTWVAPRTSKWRTTSVTHGLLEVKSAKLLRLKASANPWKGTTGALEPYFHILIGFSKGEVFTFYDSLLFFDKVKTREGKMLFFILLLTTIVVGVMLGSLAWVIMSQRVGLSLRSRSSGGPVKVGVVLGSGGHTSEMMRVLKALPRSHWENCQPFYVVSGTDTHSAHLAREYELNSFKRNPALHVIPRAREVGQSYFSSVWTTLLALWSSLMVVYRERPHVLLTNGPGVCLPVILAGFFLPAWCPWYARRRPIVVYLESFTCVEHLSLTGKLLAPFLADIFTVRWEVARAAAAQVRCRGQLYRIGEKSKMNEDISEASPPPDNTLRIASRRDRALTGNYALVTVGSTHFDELIYAMLDVAVCKTLKTRFGIDKLLLQYGAADFVAPSKLPMRTHVDPFDPLRDIHIGTCGGVVIEAFAYRPKLEQLISDALLVITHAGAGTILECLDAQCPTVVVPNRRLMSDHQLELANALMQGGYLCCVPVQQLRAQLQTLDLDKLSVYPGMDEDFLVSILTASSG